MSKTQHARSPRTAGVQKELRAFRFMDIFQELLNKGLQAWAGKDLVLDREVMESMYAYIGKCVNEIFVFSDRNLSGQAKEWLSQQLYLSLRFQSKDQIMLPGNENAHRPTLVFTPLATSDVPKDDLRLLCGLCSECDFIEDALRELHT